MTADKLQGGKPGAASPKAQPTGSPAVKVSESTTAVGAATINTSTKLSTTGPKGGDAEPNVATTSPRRTNVSMAPTGNQVSAASTAAPVVVASPGSKSADASAPTPARGVGAQTKASPPAARAAKSPAVEAGIAKATAPPSPARKPNTAAAPSAAGKLTTPLSPARKPKDVSSPSTVQSGVAATVVPAASTCPSGRPSPCAASSPQDAASAAANAPVAIHPAAPAAASKHAVATTMQPSKPTAGTHTAAATAAAAAAKAAEATTAAPLAPPSSPAAQASVVHPTPAPGAGKVVRAVAAANGAAPEKPAGTNTADKTTAEKQVVASVQTTAQRMTGASAAAAATATNVPSVTETTAAATGAAARQAPGGPPIPATPSLQVVAAPARGASSSCVSGGRDTMEGASAADNHPASHEPSMPTEPTSISAPAFKNDRTLPQRLTSQPPPATSAGVERPATFLPEGPAAPEPPASDRTLSDQADLRPTRPSPASILKLPSKSSLDKAVSVVLAPGEVERWEKPSAPPFGLKSSAQAAGSAAGPAGNAACVQVVLEGNPGGPCPVGILVSALDPGGGGEVMVADLVTAAIKALRSRYGAVQAGPSVKAFFVDKLSRERRLLPTFDSVPQELLKGEPEAGVVLQGVTCGDKGGLAVTATTTAMSASLEPHVSHAVIVPLPGFTEEPESGAAGAAAEVQNRVSFLSESLVRIDATADACKPLDGPGPVFIQTRSLLRNTSAGGGIASMKGGRILGNGHRSVRIRTEDNTVETLCIESAAPSVTSVCSNWRGGKLPPVRGGGSSLRRRSLGGPSGVGQDSNLGRGSRSPSRTRLLTARSSKRLAVEETAIESVGSADFMAPTLEQDPVEVLRPGASITTTKRPALGGPPSVPILSGTEQAPTLTGAGALTPGAGAAALAVSPSAARPLCDPGSEGGMKGTAMKAGMVVRAEAADTGNVNDVEAMFFPVPAADWLDLMGPDPPDSLNHQQSGGCLGLLSKFSANAKMKQQQQWRGRLRAALKTRDEAELAAWLAFHRGRSGTDDQAELDAALWLAVETKSPELVRLLLRSGAQPDTPRPTGPVIGVSAGLKAAGGSKVAAATLAATGPWWSPSATAGALEGITPLMRAAELASPSLVEVLLQSGANFVAVHPATGWTPLHRALLATPSSVSTSMRSKTSLRGVAAAGMGSADSNSSAGVVAAAVDTAAAGTASANAGDGLSPRGSSSDEALHCARLLLQRIGLQRAATLTTAGKHEDDLLRFAVRHGRSAALRWLLSNGLAAIVHSDEDEASCAYLAGQLGVTVEVWDRQPPLRSQQPPPTRDPARPLSWLVTPEEQLFADQRRQLLMGAAAAGRLDVLGMILDKPVPYDRLRRDELEAAIGACRLAQPRNQRQVEDLLGHRAHTYMAWDRELLPALQRMEVATITEWLLRDRPLPAEVDRALATLLSAERLGASTWQENAAAAVKALLDAGADVDYTWGADDQDEHLGVGIISKSLSRIGAAAVTSVTGGGVPRTLCPLLAALKAPAPAVVRQLLAAGADPRKRDGNGENALFFAVRTAIRANNGADGSGIGGFVESAPIMMLSPGSRAESSVSSGDAVAVAATAECIASLLATDYRSELLAARNDVGLSPAFLAAVADLPRLLKQLCDAGADPWAATMPVPPGIPEAPQELLGSGAGAKPSVWSVGHEAARCGALASLTTLLSTQPSSSRKTQINLETHSTRKREALVGAIRGGRVGAAKIALDAGGVGGGGSLYESELEAALALCRISAAAAPLPPPSGVAAGVGAADPPRYEALEAFLSSRAHVYMSWEAEVLPALRAANPGIVRRWISGDRISAAEATRGLCTLVEAAQSCGVSASSTAEISAVAASATDGGASSGGNGLAGELRRDLSNLSSSTAADAARAGGSAKAVAEIASALIQAGADVNYQLPKAAAGSDGAATGQTLLIQAVSRGNLPLVEVLLAAGARLDTEDAAGFTAVDVAVVSRQRLGDSGTRCLQHLLEPYGARRLNAHRTHAGDSALMLAVRAGDTTTLQQLLAAGATPAAADADAPAAAPPGGLGASATAFPPPPALASPTAASPFVAPEASTASAASITCAPSGRAQSSTQPGGRSLGTFPSGLARRGTAVYLAARVDDREMLHTLLRSASKGDGGLDACRQEVQLGALHGGRLALLEVSLGLPELLKAVPGPAEAGGSGALAAAATVSARLAEQAAVRLAEAQGLMRELEAAAATGPEVANGASLAPADVARIRRYVAAKARTLEAVAAVHERMGKFYEDCRARLQGLEGALEAKKELVSSRIRDGADAQVKLLSASTRLTASKDLLMRSVLARRDAQVGRVEAMLDRRLAGLSAAQRRAEAKVSSEVEGLVMEMRKTVARRLKEIDVKKSEGMNRLEALERKVDTTWARKQRLLAGRPPNVRVALNQRMSALMQQLLAARQSLQERLDFAVTKLESQQRRGTGMVNLDGMRGVLARQQQEVAKAACEAAARAKMAISDRAEELLREDKHDDLLRIVSQMQAEVNRGSANATAATSKTLGTLQQAFLLAEDQLRERMAQAKARMQEHLTNVVGDHAAEVKALTTEVAGGQMDDLPTIVDTPPDVSKLLQGLNLVSYLEGVDGGKSGGRGSDMGGDADPLAYLGGLRRILAVEDMIEDMIADMNDQVLHAFPNDSLCDTLDPTDLAPLLEPPDTDLITTGLGVERLREDLRTLDLTLPNMDLVLTDIDLSPLDDDNTGAMRGIGMGSAAYDDPDEYSSRVGGGGGRGGYGGGRGGHGGRDSEEYEYGGGGRYNAADYADRPEDDFALSYS